MKHILAYLLLIVFVFSVGSMRAQFDENKERKKVFKAWKISKRKRKKMDAYNPYIDKKTGKSKHLASKQLAAENKKVEKQQKKLIRREKRQRRKEGKGYKK